MEEASNPSGVAPLQAWPAIGSIGTRAMKRYRKASRLRLGVVFAFVMGTCKATRVPFQNERKRLGMVRSESIPRTHVTIRNMACYET